MLLLHNSRRITVVCALLALGCGPKTSPPPNPGQMRGTPPDLRGRTVIVLPTQQVRGVRGNVDAELAFGLTDRGGEIDWVMPDSIEGVLSRSPGVDATTRGLPVGHFMAAEVRRIGDPLFGQLRRMSVMVDAEAVLIPIAATFEPNPEIINGQPRVRLTVTLIEPRTGNVVWFGVEEGGDYTADDPRGLASAVENLTRTLLWYLG